jgi:hypothetical protein
MSKLKAPIPDYKQEPEEYLQHHGWRPGGYSLERGDLWRDPTRLTTKVEKVPVGTRQLPDREVETIYQTQITYAEWPMPTHEAVTCQRLRDQAEALRA